MTKTEKNMSHHQRRPADKIVHMYALLMLDVSSDQTPALMAEVAYVRTLLLLLMFFGHAAAASAACWQHMHHYASRMK